jgi:hypothetical protein
VIKCREAAKLMSQAMDRPLPFWQRLALGLHLAICDACRNARRQMLALRAAVGRLLESRS